MASLTLNHKIVQQRLRKTYSMILTNTPPSTPFFPPSLLSARHSEFGGIKLIAKILLLQAMQSEFVFLITICTEYYEIALKTVVFFLQENYLDV